MAVHVGNYTALPFPDRKEAGRALGQYLSACLKELGKEAGDLVVVGLPRGGVVVAAEVARTLGTFLDVLPTRKLGAPYNPELAIGAVSLVGEPYLTGSALRLASREWIDKEICTQRARVARQIAEYRKSEDYSYLSDKVAVVVDDGTATGATAVAACNALRKLEAKGVWVAVPVAPQETLDLLDSSADEVFCLASRTDFQAVGMWYVDFGQTSDEEVLKTLEEFWRGRRPP